LFLFNGGIISLINGNNHAIISRGSIRVINNVFHLKLRAD